MFLNCKSLSSCVTISICSSLSLNGASWCEADPYMDKFFHQLNPGGYHSPWMDNTGPQQPVHGIVGADAQGMSTFTPNPDYDTPVLDKSSANSWAAKIDGYTSYPFVDVPFRALDPIFNGHYRFIYAENEPVVAGFLPSAPAAIPATPLPPVIKSKKSHRHIFAVGHFFSRAFYSARRLFTRKVHDERKTPHHTKKS